LCKPTSVIQKGYLSYSLMNAFFSKVVGFMSTEVKSEDILMCWSELCKAILGNSKDSTKQLFGDLVNAMKQMCATNPTDLVKVLVSKEIPAKLVGITMSEKYKGYVNDVLVFFTEISKKPLSFLLRESAIVKPLNTLIDNAPPSNADNFSSLIESLIKHLTEFPDDIHLFVLSESSAPLIHQIIQMIVSKYTIVGELIVHFLSKANICSDLLSFLVNYSPFIAICIEFIRDCTISKSFDSYKVSFLLSLNLSLRISPQVFLESFSKAYQLCLSDSLFQNHSDITILRNAMYQLVSFDHPSLLAPVIVFLESQIPKYLDSKNNDLIQLAIRACTLVLDHSEADFGDHPKNIKVSLDYMGLLNAEWMLRSGMNGHLTDARIRVSTSLTKSQARPHSLTLRVTEILQRMYSLLDNYLDNSIEVNMALTEFFIILASSWGQAATFYMLSSDCESGLFNKMQSLCCTITRRLGSKVGIVSLIDQAYDRELNSIQPSNEEEVFYQKIVLAIEFVIELHATAQSKNLINQNEMTINSL